MARNHFSSTIPRDLQYALTAFNQIKQGKSINIMNISDIQILQQYDLEDDNFDFNLEFDQIIEVLEQKRSKQFNLDRETYILFQVMTSLKNHKMIYSLIDEYVPYFTNYFKDMNKHYRDIKSGEILSKSILLAYILYYRLSGQQNSTLYFELQKYIFRFQRMFLSKTSKFQALVYKQQLILAKTESSQSSKMDNNHNNGVEIHPLKLVSSFFLQQMLMQQDSQLGEESWPEEINLNFEDLIRLYETQTYEYDENLFEMFTDLLMEQQENKIMFSQEKQQLSQILDFLGVLSDLVFQGYEHRCINKLMEHLINQALINIDQLQDFTLIIKSMSILNNTLIARIVDNPLLMKLVVDTIVHQFKNNINTNFKPNDIEKSDIIRLLQYCEDYDQLVEQVMIRMKDHKYLRSDIDIALYAKIGHDLILDFKMEDSTLNSKVKRMIIRNQGVQDFLKSDSMLQFMRDFKNLQYSVVDQLKRTLFKKAQDKPIDFQKISQPKFEENSLWNIQDIDECLETYFLILYSLTSINLQEIYEDKKIILNIHLIYDLLNMIIDQIDPWFIEQIIIQFHTKNLLKERLGATGETLYDITEEYVIKNWNMFSDYFRHLYRQTLYED
ncbi:UNKNOWN [Stylonychia lemnae]|uniref:Uncharacterized protein n=1 Tax=Stylonychia lemnae TaxID=5949 RepID=A0A078B460_STYLE|nr:UNKNOWN [Stylonychia lemnae]|eukprot:CDW87987.1 UNKNOWN [Stylonychia lemnae]